MSRPSIDSIDIAIEWLRSYEPAGEGPDPAYSACHQVANWLQEKADRARLDAYATDEVMKEAKRLGKAISRRQARRILTKLIKRSNGSPDLDAVLKSTS